MRRITIAFVLPLMLVLSACTQSATSDQSASPTVSARATASAAASASAGASGQAVDLKVVVPEPNAKAGLDGVGWSIDVVAKGKSGALEQVRPQLQSSTTAGRNPAFPGLVIMLSTTPTSNGMQGPKQNLAKLFQLISLPDTTGQTGVSITSATSSPSAPAAARATDTLTAEATWLIMQPNFGTGTDVELTAFIVEGDAPDVIGDTSSLKIVSNQVNVRFHVNGTASPSASPGANATGTLRATNAPATNAPATNAPAPTRTPAPVPTY